jgi:hypothetical protein
MWGIAPMALLPIHIAVPRNHKPLVHARIHRLKLAIQEIAIIRYMRVTTVSRTLLDLASYRPALRLAKAMHEAEYRGVLDLQEFASTLARHKGHRGVRVLREAVRLNRGGSAGVRSSLEMHFFQGVLALGIELPLVNTPVSVGDRTLEVDFLWPRHQLIVEIDGPGHDRPWIRQQDYERDKLLVAAGYEVIRCRAHEISSTLHLVARRVSPHSTYSGVR